MKQKIVDLLNEENAVDYVVDYLRFKTADPTSTIHGHEYGYDLYLPNLMRKWYKENFELLDQQESNQAHCMEKISSYFYNACWELCRIGVLRPGITSYQKQSTEDGSAGNGYSITPFGMQWLKESDKDTFIPTEPGRFSQMLKPYSEKFGPGFHERANQAIRCYGAHTYLACCVMCGSAAESILLHLAIQKDGDEKNVLKLYRPANGRKKIIDMLLQGQKSGFVDEFKLNFGGLLKYWRDEGAHGRKSSIAEAHAYTSLSLLLRCAIFANDNYEVLTKKKNKQHIS